MQIKITYAPGGNIYNVNPISQGAKEVNGIMYSLAKLLTSSLNSTYSIGPPLDKKWGSIVTKSNGKQVWNGMLGDIHRDRVRVQGMVSKK